MFKKGDIILIAVLIVLALAYFLFAGSAQTATVYYNGNVYTELRLDRDITLEVGGAVIRVEDGKIFFEESDCPNKLCVKCGKLYRAGQTASCVPNKIVIVLSGRNSPDGVTG